MFSCVLEEVLSSPEEVLVVWPGISLEVMEDDSELEVEEDLVFGEVGDDPSLVLLELVTIGGETVLAIRLWPRMLLLLVVDGVLTLFSISLLELIALVEVREIVPAPVVVEEMMTGADEEEALMLDVKEVCHKLELEPDVDSAKLVVVWL